jgi:hypothetical protein
MKKIFVVLVVAVLLSAGLLFFASKKINPLVENLIEKAGTAVLKTPVQVDGVDIRLAEGRAEIRGLWIANPEGFDSRPALSFGKIAVEIDIADRSVREIVTESPHFFLQVRDQGSNFLVLQKNLDETASRFRGPDGESSKPREEQPVSDKKDRVIRIKRIYIRDARLIVDYDEEKEPEKAVLKELEITGLEGDSRQVAGQIMEQIVKTVLQRVAERQLEKEAGRLIENWMKKD